MSSFFGNSSLFVGMEKTATGFRLATLLKKAKGWEIAHLKELTLEESGDLFDKLSKDAIITTALTSREVLVRPLELPLKKERDIQAALPFQMEPHLPYPLEKCLLQKTIVETEQNGTLLTVYSTKKDSLRSHLDQWKAVFIDPDHVTSLPHALVCFTRVLALLEDLFFIVYLGEREGICILAEKGKVISARAMDKEISQIQKTILAMSSGVRSKKIDSILFVGEESHWKEKIEEATEKKVTFPQLTSISSESLLKFAPAIGMAIAGGEGGACNFRQNEFTYPRPWKKIRKPLLLFGIAASFLFASVYGLTSLLLHKEEKRLQQEFAILSSLESTKEEPPFSLEYIEQSLEKMQSQIQARPDTFPLLPLIPQVHDMLAWLASHPQLIDESTQMEIESFHYFLEKRPEFSRKNEHYLVKVELEFSTPNPLAARSFYDALIAPNSLIDSKKEVQWNPGKGRYLVSFYLKDKTRYP